MIGSNTAAFTGTALAMLAHEEMRSQRQGEKMAAGVPDARPGWRKRHTW